jgi:hypothetical protein
MKFTMFLMRENNSLQELKKKKLFAVFQNLENNSLLKLMKKKIL